MPSPSPAMFKGTLVSISSSVLFGAVFFVTPLLAPLAGLDIWASRVLVTIPFIAILLAISGRMQLFTDIFERIKNKPLLLIGLLATALLLSLQLWLFSWAPINGRGMQVAMGYFLLPLVLLVVGRFLYRDRLKFWHWAAAALAATGVTYQIATLGGVSWETLLVCGGYPIYFILRRALKTASTGGMLWDFILVSPFAIFLLVREISQGTAFYDNPELFWFVPLFGVFTALALWLYVLASSLLPLSIFGLLSYVEPALLVVAALLIGERIAPEQLITYGAIWGAVLILLIGGIFQVVRSSPKR